MKLPYWPAKDGLFETLLCRSDGSKEGNFTAAIIKSTLLLMSDSYIKLVEKQRNEVVRGTVEYILRTLLPL